MSFLRVSAPAYVQILDDLKKKKKISAIKLLRRECNAGLKEAKEAIEKIQHEQGHGQYPNAARNAAKVIVGPVIKKITCDFGEGDIEVDLENMQLVALMQMQKIGLDACGDILDLVQTLQAFANGKRIGVLNE